MSRKHSIKINAVLSMLKQLCQVIFPLITVPYVTRTIHKANYGKVDFSSSIISYFSLLATLGIQLYAIREGSKIRDDKKKLNEFVNEIFTINVVSAGCSYFLLIISMFTIPKLADYRLLLFIMSFSIIFTTFGTDWINTIYEDFGYITLRYIIVQILSIAALFIFVRKPSDYIAFAAITVAANAGANIFNIFYIRKYVHIRLTRVHDLKLKMIPILLLFGNTVASTIYINSDITLLGIFKSDSDVGVYSLASKIYNIVKNLLNAFTAVIIPRLSYYLGNNDKKEFRLLSEKSANILIMLCLPALTGLAALSRDIIILTGGKEYEEGATALLILSLSLVFAVLGCLYGSCFLVVIGCESRFLAASVSAAVINIVLNFGAIPLLGINGAALTTLAAEITAFTISFVSMYKKKKILPDLKNVVSTGAGCLVILLICTLVKAAGLSSLPTVILAVPVSAVLYFAVLLLFKNTYAAGLLSEALSKLKKH